MYIFGLGPGWLNKKAEAIAKKHGANLVNYTDPQCQCGYGCLPYECKRSRRHWFTTQNFGEPYNSQTANTVLNELEV